MIFNESLKINGNYLKSIQTNATQRKATKNNEKQCKTSLKLNAFIDSAFFIQIRCSGQRPSSSHDPMARAEPAHDLDDLKPLQ